MTVMTQDFAKIRPEPLLEKKPASTPPAWSLMITGVVLGVTIGVFACVLLYASGHVPPISQAFASNAKLANSESAEGAPDPTTVSDLKEPALEYEFYRELQEYEVLVNATPVDLGAQDPNRRLERDYLLQTGAFERRELAETEQSRQSALGLNVFVKDPGILGRSLFLVQSGPFSTQGELDDAETVLRRNSIPFLRLTAKPD
ncbi:MAG: hypothetical protein CMD92_01105 [Gammaproteobacteria bacterium]|nr:hypothetical protein [Gammaproteobacteria bacterium]HBW84715.1 hypothetical protein [Gammaproteobacteria bacterium]|tara:strand:+ start:11789 stop:12394 length:606 start_codon:yes stop_codon:yes gene_type:complete